MKPLKERELKDFKIELIQGKKKYIAEAMELRRRMLEEKEGITELRKKKKLWQSGSQFTSCISARTLTYRQLLQSALKTRNIHLPFNRPGGELK